MAERQIEIDGSLGEGGGQILRTSLSLSMVTGTPFRIENIRSGRRKPGLLRQHLTAVNAAAAISSATVEGAELGSQELRFVPGEVRGGDYDFAVGTAGSATLVLQTVLPPLLLTSCASQPSSLAIEGGTHNPMAPPFDFLARSFLPLVERMGPKLTARLERPGFYPAGGGRFSIEIEPAAKLARFELNERGDVRSQCAKAMVAHLSPQIGHRELKVVRDRLGWGRESLRLVEVDESAGPGNVLTLEVQAEHVTEIVTGFGEKGTPAPEVASSAVDELERLLVSGAPVGEHLADQLILPLAIGSGGVFRTLPLTPHTVTNIDVVRRFLGVEIRVTEGDETVVVEVG